MGSNSFIEKIRRNRFNTELFQYITSFTFGLAFGAVSFGLMWYFLFIMVYELFYAILTGGIYPFWSFRARVSVNLLGIIGWALGRWIYLEVNPATEAFGKNCSVLDIEYEY